MKGKISQIKNEVYKVNFDMNHDSLWTRKAEAGCKCAHATRKLKSIIINVGTIPFDQNWDVVILDCLLGSSKSYDTQKVKSTCRFRPWWIVVSIWEWWYGPKEKMKQVKTPTNFENKATYLTKAKTLKNVVNSVRINVLTCPRMKSNSRLQMPYLMEKLCCSKNCNLNRKNKPCR